MKVNQVFENIKTFEWEDLEGKTLNIHMSTDLSNGTDYTCKTAYGKDIKTGIKYILNIEIIEGE